MLVESGLPIRLWLEAIASANYVRNRSPVSGADLTPYEAFFRSKPDVSNLRSFGATVYLLKPEHERRKLDSRSTVSTFVGYENAAYRVWDSRRGKVLIRSDVIVDEACAHAPPSVRHPLQVICSDSEDDVPEATMEQDSGDTEMEQDDDTAQEEGDTEEEPEAVEERRYPKRERRPPTEWYQAKKPRANLATICEPASFQEALSSEQAEAWQRAINEETASLEANQTWELVTLPDGKKPLPAKWVFRVKRDAHGDIERFKARLVVKGYAQSPGIDFNEVYAPVSKYTTLRALLSKVAEEDLELRQFDVKTAFLNGDLEEEIYMIPPEGVNVEPGKVCRLVKSLYGLRQAPRAWHIKLKQQLTTLGFTSSQGDPAFFVHRAEDSVIYMIVYVDDILVAARSAASIDNFKTAFMNCFDAREMGDANYFLGMEIVRDRKLRTIKLSQSKYATELLEKHGMADAKVKSTPSSTSLKLCRKGDKLPDAMSSDYRETIGALLYLAVCTRPDIAQAVGAVARFLSAPTTVHLAAMKLILRYLKGSINLGLTFDAGQPGLLGYCDADYAGDIDSRRSTTGYAFVMNGGAISWSSKLQATVAASTVEAEYMAAAAAVKEALWLRKLLPELGIAAPCLKIKIDNQGAFKLLKHPITSARSKHIDVIHHFARERVTRGEVEFQFLRTEDMIADIFTKPVPIGKFKMCCAGLGLR